MTPSHRFCWKSTRTLIWGGLLPRLRFVAPFLMAAGLLWTGFSRLNPVISESGRLARDLGLLSTRVGLADQLVRDADADGLSSRYRALCVSMKGGESEVVAWLGSAESAALNLGLTVRKEVGDAERRGPEGSDIHQIPIRFILRSRAGIDGAVKPVRRFLQFGEWIGRSPRRADILNVSIRVPEGGAPEGVIDVRIWVLTSRS